MFQEPVVAYQKPEAVNPYLQELESNVFSTRRELEGVTQRLSWFVSVYDASKTADKALVHLQVRQRVLIEELKALIREIESIKNNEGRVSKTLRAMGWKD